MDKNLETLKKNNPSIEIVEETDHINISKLWDDSTFMCRLEKTTNFSPLATVTFPPELSAIFHKDTSTLEVIFSPILKDDTIKEREFDFYYKGVEFKATFGEPTELFKTISIGFRETDNSSDTDYRNLRKFRDYYKQETLPKYIQKYFENREPINFFIKGDFDKAASNFVAIAKHLNFYMNYYDRETPTLVIFEQEQDKKTYKTPCITTKDGFPKVINFTTFDPVLIDLFQVARRSANVRLKFIFYFQVLEYCAYYHLNDDLKKRLTNIIKRPDLLNNTNDYSKLLIEEFKDYFRQNDDSIKLEKLLADFCSWDDIKHEIECNKEYFATDLVFDGGLKIPALISEKETFETEPKGLVKTAKSNIEKIRNVLVHLRESRENKVILPTPKNNNLLIPYLHLIQRIAEKIAIQHE
ncbi:MAG: hypothetical protein HYR91_08220 [Flavobacteriia bacterium]|nr:hypothetical protein [Flavobacteriia bacterium]